MIQFRLCLHEFSGNGLHLMRLFATVVPLRWYRIKACDDGTGVRIGDGTSSFVGRAGVCDIGGGGEPAAQRKRVGVQLVMSGMF